MYIYIHIIYIYIHIIYIYITYISYNIPFISIDDGEIRPVSCRPPAVFRLPTAPGGGPRSLRRLPGAPVGRGGTAGATQGIFHGNMEDQICLL